MKSLDSLLDRWTDDVANILVFDLLAAANDEVIKRAVGNRLVGQNMPEVLHDLVVERVKQRLMALQAPAVGMPVGRSVGVGGGG